MRLGIIPTGYKSLTQSMELAMKKSKGHVEFIGPFEYFYGSNGDLFRAPKDSPLDVWGYRMGARFESTPPAAETCLKLAREAFEKSY